MNKPALAPSMQLRSRRVQSSQLHQREDQLARKYGAWCAFLMSSGRLLAIRTTKRSKFPSIRARSVAEDIAVQIQGTHTPKKLPTTHTTTDRRERQQMSFLVSGSIPVAVSVPSVMNPMLSFHLKKPVAWLVTLADHGHSHSRKRYRNLPNLPVRFATLEIERRKSNATAPVAFFACSGQINLWRCLEPLLSPMN